MVGNFSRDSTDERNATRRLLHSSNNARNKKTLRIALQNVAHKKSPCINKSFLYNSLTNLPFIHFLVRVVCNRYRFNFGNSCFNRK